MARKRSDALQYLMILVLGLAIAGILFYMIPYRYNLNTTLSYDMDPTVIDNPLMGFAPNAEDIEQCEVANLVYVDVTWADWEPQQGKYDIAALEARCNIAKWKADGKNAIVRFVCDIPGEEDHIDIPQWVYDETGDGTHYNNDYGKGYSPDYANSVFMEHHRNAIKALAEYCNKDYFVAFVELGSIGHWGEWHATASANRNLMPSEEICIAYVDQYMDYFGHVKFLTRRNYDFAVVEGMGQYNDMVGSIEDTNEWLDWLSNGGEQATVGEILTLEPVNLIGRKTPIGGEFTSSIDMDTMMGSGIGDVLSMVSNSHMTFIGPMVPDLLSEEYENSRTSILKKIGYRIYVSKLKTQYDFSQSSLDVDFTFENAGNAGFFYEWPVMMKVYNANKELIYWQSLELDLSDLGSGTSKTVRATIPYSEEIRDEFYIGITIKDLEGKNQMIMAVDLDQPVNWIDDGQIIYHYKR